MASRKTWVPTHSIIVMRDGKQVDAYEEYKRDGKAFSFTDDEVKEIQALNPNSLRTPVEEAAAQDVAETPTKMSPGTDDAQPTGGKEVVQTDDAKDTSKAKTPAADKDADL